ncbi:MAG: hypothetical protein HY674_18590 [Chloroflexi bacterium]|nr:hypothetical protein [Chloroflexota bacterium]
MANQIADFDKNLPAHYSFLVSESLFPSGPWVGFYNYQPGDRHRMNLNLAFAGGQMTGDGNDDIGRFHINGRYDAATRECHWTKTYVGAHDVFYRGFREGKGIWGTWDIAIFSHGGFHIWPRAAGEENAETESAAQEQPVEAMAGEALAGGVGVSPALFPGSRAGKSED